MSIAMDTAIVLRSDLIANIIFTPGNEAGNPVCLDSRHRASKSAQ